MSGFTGQAEIVVAIREPVERIWLHGQDLEVSLVVPLERINSGGDETVRFTRAVTCPTCSGLGQIIKNPCNTCGGGGRVDESSLTGSRFPWGTGPE